MNRQEAAIIIKAIGKHAIETHLTDPGDILDATVMAVQALVPKPDEVTGLVPCGCGCNPELRAVDRGWYQVYCTGCDMHGGYSHTPNNVIEEWNEAMGWKGGAE